MQESCGKPTPSQRCVCVCVLLTSRGEVIRSTGHKANRSIRTQKRPLTTGSYEQRLQTTCTVSSSTQDQNRTHSTRQLAKSRQQPTTQPAPGAPALTTNPGAPQRRTGQTQHAGTTPGSAHVTTTRREGTPSSMPGTTIHGANTEPQQRNSVPA